MGSMQTGMIPAPPAPAPGSSFRAQTLIGCAIGPWVPERLLGEGAWGAVFLARHSREGKRAALKVPKLGDTQQADHILARFRQEVKTLEKVHAAGQSPHVVGLMGADAEARPYPWLALEYVEGTDLGSELKRRRKFPPRDALRLSLVVLDGLAEAHRAGVVHRDLKPENVLMTLGGEIRIGDFGVARSVVRDREDGVEVAVTVTGQQVGTPHFMSPEQIEGKADPRGDIYSFGAMLYDMVTGRPPFRGSKLSVVNAHLTKNPPPPSDFVVGLPPELDDLVVQKLMAKEPEQRPSIEDAQEKIKEVLKLLDEIAEKPKEDRAVALELKQGDEVGDYVIDREIGRGGMGIVYAARDQQGDWFALKVAGFAFSTQEEARRQLMRDAENAIEVTKQHPHPAVAQVHRVVEDVVRGIPIVYLVSELVPGLPLQDVVSRNGPLDEKTAIKLWIQVAEGLASIHESGVLHLDITPGNILLAGVKSTDESDGENHDAFLQKVKASTPKIVDFGISKKVGSQTLRGVEGNPGYMSPEQCDGLAPSFASDVYMFGATFYHITTGRPLYTGEPLAVMNKHRIELPRFADLEDPALGYDLALVIHKCLAKSAENRFKTVPELVECLRQLGKPEFPRSQLKLTWEREQRALEKRSGIPVRLIAALVAIFVVCIVGLGVYARGASQRGEAETLGQQVKTLSDGQLAAFHNRVRALDAPALRTALDARAKELVSEALAAVAAAAQTIPANPDGARESLAAVGREKLAPLLAASKEDPTWFATLGDSAQRLKQADAHDLPAYAVLCKFGTLVRDEKWDEAAAALAEVPQDLTPEGTKVRAELVARQQAALGALAAALYKVEAAVTKLVDPANKEKDFDGADKAARDFAVEQPRYRTHKVTADKLAALETKIKDERAKNPEAIEASRSLKELEGKLAEVKLDEMLDPSSEGSDQKRDTLAGVIRDLDSWLGGHPQYVATRAGGEVRSKLDRSVATYARWAAGAWKKVQDDADREWKREESPDKFDKLVAIYGSLEAAWARVGAHEMKLGDVTIADTQQAALARVKSAQDTAIDRPLGEAEKALRLHDLSTAAECAKRAHVFESTKFWTAADAERIKLVEAQVAIFQALDASAVLVPLESGARLRVDVCETTVEAYGVFLQWTKGHESEARALLAPGDVPPPFVPPDWEKQSKHPGRPVANVSAVEAAAFARWAGRRLPTVDEWLFLARGPGAGDEERMTAWLDGARAHGWAGRAPFEAGQSGEKNAFGIQDTSGNVSEWTATENPKHPGRFFYCGANYDTPRNVESYDLRRKNYRPRTDRLPTLGFRCVREESK
jgi:serine/threonine protein kinase